MDDIPKSIIIILLILTVVISVLGTWTVIDEVEKTKAAQNPAIGQVRLNILGNPEQKSSYGSGKVTLNILEGE